MAEDSLRAAQDRVENNFEPRWYFVTKGGRTDTPSGSIEEIVPSIELPGRYNYASAVLRGGEAAIDITLSSAGPSITLTGSDEAWLRQTERWSNEALREHRPRWWWVHTVRGGIFAVLLGYIAYLFLLNVLPLAGVPRDAAALLGLGADWAILLCIFISATRFRASILEPGLPHAKAISIQAGLLLAGAILGVIVTRIADVLFPS